MLVIVASTEEGNREKKKKDRLRENVLKWPGAQLEQGLGQKVEADNHIA